MSHGRCRMAVVAFLRWASLHAPLDLDASIPADALALHSPPKSQAEEELTRSREALAASLLEEKRRERLRALLAEKVASFRPSPPMSAADSAT